MDDGLGPLAAALAKAQSEFGAVTRDKKVTVQLKSGGSYQFSYAPLDQILGVVRAPLAKNGLALVQLLDTDALVTMLIHDSGASLEGRTPLPSTNDIQGYGSAITYLRRYAIQALLGIAAEDDDDGNRAAGNQATPQPEGERMDLIGVDTLSGTVKKGEADRYRAEWRDLEDGTHVIGFAVKGSNKNYPQVGLMGNVAAGLYATGDFPTGAELIGQKVSLRGRFYSVRQAGRTTYTRVIVGQGPDDYIATDDWRIPATSPLREEERFVGGQDAPEDDILPIPVAEGQEPLFDLVESARLDAEEAARA
jgi:hypothetical protein